MHVFVTGATGWVGSAVVKELLDAGHRVTGLVRSENRIADGMDLIRGTVDDHGLLRRAARDADAVIHTAFNHDVSKFAQNAEQDRHAIETLGSALEGSDRLLLVTSGLAGLAPGRLVIEKDVPSPSFPRKSEAAAQALAERGVRAATVRLAPTVHGLGEHGFISILIGIAREKGVSAYIGVGKNRWPAVHRQDAVRVYRLALEHGLTEPVYHAVAEEGIAFKEIAEVIGRQLGLPVESRDPGHFGWFANFAGADMPARHLLPAKHLAEWLEGNIYLNLAEAPFDTDDATLVPQAGACPDCPRQSGFNSKLFSDVQNDVCLDAACWNTKVSASLQRTMEQRPNLVQIDNGWTAPKDRKPGVLDRNSYRLISVPTGSNSGEEDGSNAINACSSGTDALIVQGNSVGSIVRVCTDPHCATHGRPLPNPVEQEERTREIEQQRREQEAVRQQRELLYNRIVAAAPEELTLDQWKFIFRAIIDSNLYSICDTLAGQYEPAPEPQDQRSAETVLLEVIQAADQKAMSAFVLRFALVEQVSNFSSEGIDYLEEAGVLFPSDAKRKRKPAAKPNRSKKKNDSHPLINKRDG